MDWTEKYRPSTLSEVRGNNKARDALKEWADTWDDHREAVILHGTPGVGKTSAAHALAIAEQNSGDLRGAIKDLQTTTEGRDRIEADDYVSGERDTSSGIFEYLDVVLKEGGAEEALKSSYDVDETPDDLINWIEDNMPKDYEGGELATAYEFLSNADRWLGRVRATQNYSFWKYAGDNMTAGVAAARDGKKGGWTRYGPPSYWSKLGRSKGVRNTRDYIARQIAAIDGVSMRTARREIMPFLATMTHHCTNRELTVAMTATYELDTDHVAFITGSGESTNKVQSVVEDAEQAREEAAVEHSGGAFAGGTASGAESDPDEETAAESDDDGNGQATLGDASEDEPDDVEETPDSEEAEEDDQQSGLSDFM